MENIKETISKNILYYRKLRKLTQVELAEKIFYSDKAISRWEKGESMPDIETLHNLSIALDIPIACFFEEEHSEDMQIAEDRQRVNKIVVTSLTTIIVWMVATILYLYLKFKFNFNFWQIFIWAVPINCAILLYFNNVWGNSISKIIFTSVFYWGVLTGIYLQFLERNLWMVFIIGVPIQCVIILNSFIRPLIRQYPTLFNHKKIKETQEK